jgi:hypothetical protein
MLEAKGTLLINSFGIMNQPFLPKEDRSVLFCIRPHTNKPSHA